MTTLRMATVGKMKVSRTLALTQNRRKQECRFTKAWTEYKISTGIWPE